MEVCKWFEENHVKIRLRVAELERLAASTKLNKLLKENGSASFETLKEALASVSEEEREALFKSFK